MNGYLRLRFSHYEALANIAIPGFELLAKKLSYSLSISKKIINNASVYKQQDICHEVIVNINIESKEISILISPKKNHKIIFQASLQSISTDETFGLRMRFLEMYIRNNLSLSEMNATDFVTSELIGRPRTSYGWMYEVVTRINYLNSLGSKINLHDKQSNVVFVARKNSRTSNPFNTTIFFINDDAFKEIFGSSPESILSESKSKSVVKFIDDYNILRFKKDPDPSKMSIFINSHFILDDEILEMADISDDGLLNMLFNTSGVSSAPLKVLFNAEEGSANIFALKTNSVYNESDKIANIQILKCMMSDELIRPIAISAELLIKNDKLLLNYL